MTQKRFNYHIDEVGVYYYVYDTTKKSDDRIILELNTKYDAIEVCNMLNELNDENEQLKQREETLLNEIKDFQDILSSKEQLCLKYVRNIIQDNIQNERTEIGKNVLKQLLEQLQ